MRFLAGSFGPAKTDGARYAAYIDDDALDTMVIDTWTGATQRYETPRGSCGELLTVADLSLGRLTWAGCFNDWDVQWSELASIDLARGERSGPSRQGSPPFESQSLTGIGRQWLRFGYRAYHSTGIVYFNRQTGQRLDEYSKPGRADQVPDLDKGALYAPLCSPLRRRAAENDDPSENLPLWIPYQYRRPYGLTTDRRPKMGSLRLDRCGSARSTELERCLPRCGSAQLGRRAVVWTIRGDVGAYLLAKRRLARRRVATMPYSEYLVAATTDGTVFVSRLGRRGWRVSTMPLRSLLASGAQKSRSAR